MSVTLTTPDGARWRVGRRWLPWRPRWRRPVDLEVPFDLPAFVDELPAVFAVLVALLLFAAFVVFVVPLLITLAELVLVALFLALGVVVRLLLRRPWLVDAVRLDGAEVRTWKVVGWRAGGELIDRVAQSLRLGGPLPPD